MGSHSASTPWIPLPTSTTTAAPGPLASAPTDMMPWTIIRKLYGAAKRTCRSRHDITVNFGNVPNPAAKIMDVVIDDPAHNGSSYYVDFHVIDPLAPSYCHTSRNLPRTPSRASSTPCEMPSS